MDAHVDTTVPFTFLSQTHEERSLVCPVEHTPAQTLERDDGWRGLYIEGVLEFSLIGILARIAAVLAESRIGILALSTYNTDYILTKAEHFEEACGALERAGYEIV